MHHVKIYAFAQEPLFCRFIFEDKTNQSGGRIPSSTVDAFDHFEREFLSVQDLFHFFLCDFYIHIFNDNLVRDLLRFWDARFDVRAQLAIGRKCILFQE